MYQAITRHNLFIKASNLGLNLATIGVLVGIAILYALIVPVKWRNWILFTLSILFVYVLQPDIFVRWLDFFLPTLTISIVVATWYLTRHNEQGIKREDIFAFGVTLFVILVLASLRFVDIDYNWLIASRPPPLIFIIILIGLIATTSISTRKLTFRLNFLLIVIIFLFIILKTEYLAEAVSRFIRSGTGQNIDLASGLDLNWLGFSYVAFRLIHTIRDRQTGILPSLSLQEYVSYVLFFPSFIAGPIDRAERFINDFREMHNKLAFQERYVEGFTRISIGIFKKFVVADTLAQGLSLNPVHALQADNTWGLWLLLYGYSLRLFFDFSGYIDIAIGIGILFGIKLPENFKQPYMQTSITKFWQSWHITLSDWARFYVFSPLSRQLLRQQPKPSSILVILTAQLATMIVIGLWHGVTINFLIWGIWHGIGLFIHKQWSYRTRRFYRDLKKYPRRQRVADLIAWIVSIQFVVLGWVWFLMPDFQQAITVFAKLFGLNQ